MPNSALTDAFSLVEARCIRDAVIGSIFEIMADPSRAVPVDRVKARRVAAHTKTSAKA